MRAVDQNGRVVARTERGFRRRSRRKKVIRVDRSPLSPDPGSDIAKNMRNSRYETAIQRWIDALNVRGERTVLAAAFQADASVARKGFGSKTGQLVEVIEGLENVSEWMGLLPSGITFECVGPVEVAADSEGEVALVRYRLSVDDFVGGGSWRFRLGDDGLVGWLEHQPDRIDDPIEEGDYRAGGHRDHDHPHTEQSAHQH